MDASRELIERYLRCYNDKDVDAMVGLFAEDAVFESVFNAAGVIRTTGREGLRALARMSAEHFEQRRQTPTTWVADGADAALEIDYWCRPVHSRVGLLHLPPEAVRRVSPSSDHPIPGRSLS